MFRSLQKWFYSLFIIQVFFVTKKRAADFLGITIFATIDVETTDNKSIRFVFRTDGREPNNSIFAKYIVECRVDERFTKELQSLNNKVLISITIVKLGIVKPNYKVIADLLLSKYIQYATVHLEKLAKEAQEQN